MMPVGTLTYLHYLDGKLSLHTNPSVTFCITFQLNSAKQLCKTLIPLSMYVHGVAPLNMEPALGNACEVSMTSSPFLELPLAMAACYRDWQPLALTPNLSVSAPHIYFDNLHFEPLPYDNDSCHSKIITPYYASQFEIFLECAHLLSCYPELPFKLTFGFPISPLKPLKHTFTPPNLLEAYLHVDVIHASIAEELHLGHYSGPFMQEKLEWKIGPFQSFPLQVIVKENVPSEPTKFHVCQHLSYKGKAQSSINDEINSDDFPTCWGKASDVAEIVHSLTPFHFSSPLPISLSFSLISHGIILPSSHVHLHSPSPFVFLFVCTL